MGFRPSKRVMWIIVSGLAAVAIGAGVAAVVLGDSTSSKRAAEPSTAPSTVASTAASTTTTVAPSWPPPKSIVLAGDSLLSTLAPALKFVAGGRGIEVTDWSSPGCGLIRGLERWARRRDDRQRWVLAIFLLVVLAVIQGIANRTGQTSSTIDEFNQRFSGRLMSLSRAHDILTDENWRGNSCSQALFT